MKYYIHVLEKHMEVYIHIYIYIHVFRFDSGTDLHIPQIQL